MLMSQLEGPTRRQKFFRAIPRWAGRAAAIPIGLAVWYFAFDYLPPGLFTDDLAAKYFGVTSAAIAAASLIWAVGSEAGRVLERGHTTLPEATSVVAPWVPPLIDTDATALRLKESFEAAGEGAGWCHYLGSYGQPQSTSALSTAFALRTLMLVGNAQVNVPLHEVCEWLRGKANADGGWSAQTQGLISRPEVTAIVASTLTRIEGKDDAVERASRSIEDVIRSGSDLAIFTNTYVLSTIVEEAPYLSLSTETVTNLLTRLLNGAMLIGEDEYCWAESLERQSRESPSTALTARAVLAIQAVDQMATVPSSAATPILRGALKWLDSASLANEATSVVRLPAPGRQELNAPRHFTAALVALGLWQAGLGHTEPARRALSISWERHDGGLWYWGSGDTPTYVTYYGLHAALIGRLQWMP